MLTVLATGVLFSCSKVPVPSPDSPLSSWMEDLYDGLPVEKVSIPGAHDAATATITAWTYWTKTQDLTVSQLWDSGVRAFDLRPAFADGTVGIYHDKYSTNITFRDALDCLVSALERHPGDFAVIIVRHESEADDDTPRWQGAFAQLLKEYQDVLTPWHKDITVGELRGHILLLSRNRYQDGPVGGYIEDWYSGKDLVSQKNARIIDPWGNGSGCWIQDYYDPDNPDDKWEEVNDMLDAAAHASNPFPLIINHVSGHLGKLPDYRGNASVVNARAASFISASEYPVGIIMMDYAGVDVSKGKKVYGKTLVESIVISNFPNLSAK